MTWLLLALACGPQPEPVRVMAAASLTDALPAALDGWGGAEVAVSFDATSRLARQLEAGAPADVFLSADTAWMDWLQDRELVHGRVDLLANAVVLVVPADAPALDLAAVDRLALAGAEVPAGRYARQALRATGAWDGVADRVVEAATVRMALVWVARGEADAGIVYATDARIEPGVRVVRAYTAAESGPVVLPAALASDDPRGAALLGHLSGPGAAPAWRAAGLTVLP